MKRSAVFAAFILLITCGSIAFGAEAAYPKPTPLQMAALGAPIHDLEPVGVNDILFLEPVCALIFKYGNLLHKDSSVGQWYIQLKDSPLLDLPENNIAKGVISFHHYCWGKVAEYRYYREMDPVKRAGLANYAADNYKFVIDHPEYRPADWPYLPKLYVDYGKALMLGGKLTQSALAINAFEIALHNNKAFVPAMIALANVYERLGEKSKALEYVAEGLRYEPSSKSLKHRYEELGGKPPYPEPYPAPQPTSHKEELKPSTATPPESKEETGKDADLNNTAPATNSTEKNQGHPAGTDSPPSDNPYCRFCP